MHCFLASNSPGRLIMLKIVRPNPAGMYRATHRIPLLGSSSYPKSIRMGRELSFIFVRLPLFTWSISTRKPKDNQALFRDEISLSLSKFEQAEASSWRFYSCIKGGLGQQPFGTSGEIGRRAKAPWRKRASKKKQTKPAGSEFLP